MTTANFTGLNTSRSEIAFTFATGTAEEAQAAFAKCIDESSAGLDSLMINMYQYQPADITQLIVKLAESKKKLRQLEISGNVHVQSEALRALTRLHLSSLAFHRFEEMHQLTASAVELAGIFGQMASLTSLTINHPKMSPVFLHGMLPGCSNITDLTIYYCKGLDNRLITPIADHCPKLKHLTIRNLGKHAKHSSLSLATFNRKYDYDSAVAEQQKMGKLQDLKKVNLFMTA